MNNLDKVKELIKNCQYEKAGSVMNDIVNDTDKSDYLFEKSRILLNTKEYDKLIFDIEKCTKKILTENKTDNRWMIFELLKIVCDNKIFNKSKYTEKFISFFENNILFLEVKHQIFLKTKMIEYFYCNSKYFKSFEYIIDLIESVDGNVEYKLTDILNISLRKLDYTVVDKTKIIKKLKSANKKITNIKIKNMLLNELEILGNKKYLESRPSSLHINLTNKCNLKCVMCHNEHAESYDIDERLINFIKNNMPYLQYISWLGGEVFLSKIFLELSCLATIYKVKQRITTNALLLNEEKIRFIVNNNIDLKISIDAAQKDLYEKIRVGGNFEKLIKNLEILNRYNKKRSDEKYMYVMAATIMSCNYMTIRQMVKFAINYGFQAIDLQRCRVVPETESLGLSPEQQNSVAIEIINLKREFQKNKKLIEINSDFAINKKSSDLTVNHTKIDANNCDLTPAQLKKDLKETDSKIFCTAPWKLLCIEKNEIYFSWMCDRINVSNCMQDDIWNCKDVVELRKKIVKNNLPNCCNVICRNAQDFGEKIRLGMI